MMYFGLFLGSSRIFYQRITDELTKIRHSFRYHCSLCVQTDGFVYSHVHPSRSTLLSMYVSVCRALAYPPR